MAVACKCASEGSSVQAPRREWTAVSQKRHFIVAGQTGLGSVADIALLLQYYSLTLSAKLDRYLCQVQDWTRILSGPPVLVATTVDNVSSASFNRLHCYSF